uniref:RxLR effector candidate protein n=1 Tax=Hyaloperonospora arabidopsidis (strain Emoy2) TaxID=559515 RepID=M4C169_HYAAE
MKVRRGIFLRLRQTVGLVLATRALVSAKTAPSLYDYKYDGTTTYCYWMDQGMQVSNFDFAYVLDEGATANPIVAGNEVEYTFTATLNLNDNVFNLTELQTTVPDPTSGLPMQIGHANIHTCSRSTVCDIFRPGGNRKIVDQETSNFTSTGTSTFRQRITYGSPGERNVFAHIILPPKDFLKKSYHFITFLTTNVEASTTNAAADDSSGMSTGVTVAMILGGVAVVVAVILLVVFNRCKRRSGHETDHFRNSGFDLPASNCANKSKSHLDWSAEPDAGYHSGCKDNFSAHNSRGPALNASALVFNDRLSRQNKTVSSSGSLHSSRGPGDSGIMYNNYDTPMQRSGNNFGASGHSGRDQFNQSQSMYPDDSMYEDESRIVEEDSDLEYGRTPDLETFGIQAGDDGPSFESETSMGTSFDFNTNDANYAQPTYNPLIGGYARESDLSSMGETAEYNTYDQPPRGDTMDVMLTSALDDDGRQASGDRSSSVSSIGTVDFTLDEPSVRTQKPAKFESLDETLTMSAIAKAKMVKPDCPTSNGFANSNASDSGEFVIHDSSTVNFGTSNASIDFASTASSDDIDGKMRLGSTVHSVSKYGGSFANNADIVGSSDFGASGVTDIVAKSEFSGSRTGDCTKPSSFSDYDEGSSFSSDLEGSSFSSGLSGSSYGAHEPGSSYGVGLGNGTDVTGSAFQATNLDNGLGDTQSTYDFHDKSYCAADSFATTASDDDSTDVRALRARRVSSADGESYEF